MLARLSAFIVWALVAATAVFWGLRLFVHTAAAPSYAVTVGQADAVRGDLSRLLGATPVNGPSALAAPPASSRFRLLGIVAPQHAQVVELDDAGRASQGVALIAVDGKMPKAYAVGAHVDGDLVLQSVSLRTASIAGQGAPAITLELPLPSAAATGTLPGAMLNNQAGTPVVVQTGPAFAPSQVQPPPMQMVPSVGQPYPVPQLGAPAPAGAAPAQFVPPNQ